MRKNVNVDDKLTIRVSRRPDAATVSGIYAYPVGHKLAVDTDTAYGTCIVHYDQITEHFPAAEAA